MKPCISPWPTERESNISAFSAPCGRVGYVGYVGYVGCVGCVGYVGYTSALFCAPGVPLQKFPKLRALAMRQTHPPAIYGGRTELAAATVQTVAAVTGR